MSRAFLSLPIAKGMPEMRARFLFRVRSEKARTDDEQLAATQSHGVLSQKRYMEITGNKVVAALAGTENFNHVEQDDFVISLRTFEGGLERSAETGCISPAYTVLAPSREVEPNFYQNLLKSQVFISHLQTTVTGIRDGKSVKFENFANIVLPLPDLATQKAIAGFLDRETARIDQLIEKKQQLLELHDQRRFSEVSHLLTRGVRPVEKWRPSGHTWMDDIPAHWQWVRMKDVCSSIIDCKNRTPPEVDESQFLVVRTTCIKNGRFVRSGGYPTDGESFREWTKRGKPKPGDVLITREAPMGEACLFPDGEEICLGQRMMLYRPNTSKIRPSYIIHTIYSSIGQQYIGLRRKGSTVGHLRVPEVYNFPLLLPPPSEQDQILEVLDRRADTFNKLRSHVITSIDRLREYRAALITAAVTGQIDVATYGKRGETDRTFDRIEEEVRK